MSEFLHKEYPKTVGRNEFWKQIKRTVNGKEVSQKDINQIVLQIKNKLKLSSQDVLLDLGCGNGALASNFYNQIKKYVGVDFSDYLIEIANEYFLNQNSIFIKNSIQSYLNEINEDNEINKILIYGCASYLSKDDLINCLSQILIKFNKLEKIFIGNIPNLKFAKEFFGKRKVFDFNLEDEKSLIGVWWCPEILNEIMNDIGFRSKIIFMPKSFYSSYYRFDILLEKKEF
tara:strand:+ start:1104 stop:1793 length:690 start_codon:yes stop_codon:yes gene_type:complete